MKKDKRTKQQRQARAKRKTWTNTERFLMKQKNQERLGIIQKKVAAEAMAAQFIEQAEEEIKEEQHIHSEECSHE